MGKFKNFLINEDMGLGDLGNKISKFSNHPDLDQKLSGAFLSTDQTGSEQPDTLGSAGHPLWLPSTDLTIPQMMRQGRITNISLKDNPIYIKLSDGTEAYFTHDEFKKIQGHPAIGKNMTIIFQRHPDDWTRNASKVDKAIVQN